MRTLVHLSDLHFGRVRPELLDPLLRVVAEAQPALVVISGDLTQRARHHQFRQAKDFLDRLTAPYLVIPGNHDVPLDNLALRLLSPFGRYRRWIAAELEPGFVDEEVQVIGVNTVNNLDWQRGRIGRRAVARICAALDRGGAARTRIIAAHHPFAHAPGEPKSLMRGARTAIAALAGCGADVVLSGHLHAWRAEPLAVTGARARNVLLVQAGTGLSTRVRGEGNDFNLLRIEPDAIEVQRHVAGPEARFFLERTALFRRDGSGWHPAR